MAKNVTLKFPEGDEQPTAVYPLGEQEYGVGSDGLVHDVPAAHAKALKDVGWTVVEDAPVPGDPVAPPVEGEFAVPSADHGS